MTDASQMGNVLARNEERQRQNSLRRLIEQRESEGFGYDQLSNESAKYDIDAANAMRREFRDSYKFNQNQSDVELQRYKREMADYWFGEVLRRAQLAGLGPSELKEVCFEAAGLIAPYDSELAYRLLMQSEKMYSGEAKRAADAAKQNKPIKDDTEAINSNQKKYSVPAQDFDKNPVQYRENWVLSDVDSALKRWKTGGEYDAEKYAHYKGYSRPIWLPMEDALMAEVRKHFPNYNKSSGQFNAARKWLQGLNDDELSTILGGVIIEKESENSNPQNSVTNPKATATNAPSALDNEVEGGLRLPKSLVYFDPDVGAKRVKDQAVAELNTYIPELITKDEFRSAYKLASQLSGLESGENTAYKDVKAQIDKRQKEVSDELSLMRADGNNVTENDLKKFKDLFGSRASMSTLRAMMNFNSGVSSYYTKSPMTTLVNFLLVAEPNYKPTVDEFKAARRLHGSISDNFKSILSLMNIPIVSQWADYANDRGALYAAAMGSTNTAREIWSSLIFDVPEEKRPEAEAFLRKQFKIGDEAFAILNGDYDLAFDDDEYDAELAKRMKARKSRPVYSVDLKEGGNGISQGSKKYTAKSWEDFE